MYKFCICEPPRDRDLTLSNLYYDRHKIIKILGGEITDLKSQRRPINGKGQFVSKVKIDEYLDGKMAA